MHCEREENLYGTILFCKGPLEILQVLYKVEFSKLTIVRQYKKEGLGYYTLKVFNVKS